MANVDDLVRVLNTGRSRMRINKTLHHPDGLYRIGLIKFWFGRLLVKTIRSHVIHLFRTSAVGKQLKISLEKIFRIYIVLLVKGAISHLIINVLKFFAGFVIRNYILKKLISII